jgi:Protein kinase domain
MTQDFGSGVGGLHVAGQIAGYEIQEQIGRGGMAVVYRALDLRLGRLVALKVLAPQLSEDVAFRQRFIRESRAAAGVDHPHIVPVFEAGEASGLLFIAMRYVSHGDVRMLIDRVGELPTERALAITTQVASALDAAHSRGLVHRDVKPGNMLLGQTGAGTDHVYLSDFGLSKHSLAASTLTSTGQFMGTLDYVSPEQIQGGHADGRSDQYALACTVVEMLSGTTPFRHEETMALLWAKLEDTPPPLTQRRHDLPPAVDEVIATALARAPAQRYPTCLAFAAALRAATAAPRRHVTRVSGPPVRPASGGRRYDRPAANTPVPEEAMPVTRIRQRGRRSRMPAVLIAVSVIAVLGAIAARALTYHRAAPPPVKTASSAQQAAHTVRAYFAAINAGEYRVAWRLRGDPPTFSNFVAGFAGTATDRVTIVSVNGNVVTVRLYALQTSGAPKQYAGTYTVANGEITAANVHQVSG